MDYELSGSSDMQAYGYNYTSTGYDELCTPEHITTAISLDLPETYRGEVMDWVVLNELYSTHQCGAGLYRIDEVWPAGTDENGESWTYAFIIRAPFEGWTGYKRIEITKSK